MALVLTELIWVTRVISVCFTKHFDPFFLVKETNCETKENLEAVLDLPQMSSFIFMNQKIP